HVPLRVLTQQRFRKILDCGHGDPPLGALAPYSCERTTKSCARQWPGRLTLRLTRSNRSLVVEHARDRPSDDGDAADRVILRAGHRELCTDHRPVMAVMRAHEGGRFSEVARNDAQQTSSRAE